MPERKHKYVKKQKVTSKSGKTYTRYWYAGGAAALATLGLITAKKTPSMAKLAKFMGVHRSNVYRISPDKIAGKLHEAGMTKKQANKVVRMFKARRAIAAKAGKAKRKLGVKTKGTAPKSRKSPKRGQLPKRKVSERGGMSEKEFMSSLKAAMARAGKI